MVSIGSNISSLQAQRRLAESSSLLANSYQRLSSGQRINTASDDAAGLSMVQTLNAQSRLSHVAMRNTNDAISMINIINGALDSQKEILTRLAELAEQGANGVYSRSQRTALNNEYQQLMLEFDRIASSTEFNGQKLLKDPNQSTIQIMAGITGADTSLLQMTLANSHRFSGVYGQRSDVNGDGLVGLPDGVYSNTADPDNIATRPAILRQNAQGYATIAITDSQGRSGTVRISISRTLSDLGQSVPLDPNPPANFDIIARAFRDDGEIKNLNASGGLSSSADGYSVNFTYDTSGATASFSIDLTGIEYASYDAGVEVRQTAIGFTHLEYREAAGHALETVKNRLEDIAALQGQYGAIQTRLNAAHSVLSVSRESLMAAESRIKDADLAQETANLIRAQILQQAGANILAQANQQPKVALQLLQN